MKNDDTNRGSETDNLQRRLRDQPLKGIPPAWRNEILAAAQETSAPRPAPHVSRFTFPALLQHLVGPHPKAWAALATVWLVILGLNYSARESASVREARQISRPTSEIRQALKQKELLFAELMGQPVPPDAERPKPVPPRPHSQRRVEFQTA